MKIPPLGIMSSYTSNNIHNYNKNCNSKKYYDNTQRKNDISFGLKISKTLRNAMLAFSFPALLSSCTHSAQHSISKLADSVNVQTVTNTLKKKAVDVIIDYSKIDQCPNMVAPFQKVTINGYDYYPDSVVRSFVYKCEGGEYVMTSEFALSGTKPNGEPLGEVVCIKNITSEADDPLKKVALDKHLTNRKKPDGTLELESYTSRDEGVFYSLYDENMKIKIQTELGNLEELNSSGTFTWKVEEAN